MVSSRPPYTGEISFPEELPVSASRDEIAAALDAHQVIIVAGETGSGKTTQLPKIALALGRSRIAHTQPRRIAARAVAERIAEELDTELGDAVGYQVRFTDKIAEHTHIRLMTDGILLNQIHHDRTLRRYDTIIIDEAHERSLNIDFLLGYLSRLLPKRPDLKVIITSATIDPVSFSKHFNDAPIIEVSGRTYPVEVRYRPLVDDDGERDLFDGVTTAVAELQKEGPGDILVFFSGESEIRDAADVLQGWSTRSGGANALEILPLFGRLSTAEQHRVFRRPKGGTRRVVLATNVAETSLTVPGITYVIDAGTARVSRYSHRSKVQRLPIERISQASAGQRAGRSGRTSPGIAVRLYSEEDFDSRPEFTEPEILRTGLASVILRMLSLRLGDITEFPFLTPPDKRGVKDGLGLLEELGAVHNGEITQVGRKLSRLPIEPRFARMVIESARHGVTRDVIALVAGLTVQDVRERPEAERGRADQSHARFTDPDGDLMTLLNLWNYLETEGKARSSSAFRRLCKAEYLNFLRVREWTDLVRQLHGAARQLGLKTGAAQAGSELIHRSMLAGLLSQLGIRDDRKDRTPPRGKPGGTGRRKPAQEYIGSRGTRFVLHPGSTLTKNPPETIMSVELVETSRLFARGNAIIDPAWAEEIAGPLAKHQVSEPHWQKSYGAAVAFEKVTLFGVVIVDRRRIQVASYDAGLARELFVRHALVHGEWESPQKFDRANWQLRRELERLEERTRRRDIVSDDERIYSFYDARLPVTVVGTRSFEGWWKSAQHENPKLLHLKREDLIENDSDEAESAEFPREWRSGDQTLELRYRFDPTAEDDGVTLQVPLPLLPRLVEADFAQLVPGLRRELVTALIKSLPKQTRKHVVPAADWAKRLLEKVEPRLDDSERQHTLLELLAQEIRLHTSQNVTPADFNVEKLPSHLRPTFRVIDERGKTVGSGKDLAALQKKYHDHAAGKVAEVSAAARQGPKSAVVRDQRLPLPSHELEQTGLKSWPFDTLPQYIDTTYSRRGSGTVRAYPALIDRRTSVDVRLVPDANEQQRLSRRGLKRLVMLSSPSPASYVREHLTNDEKLLLSAGPYRTLEQAITDVSLATAEAAIHRHVPSGLIWSRDVFETIANDFAASMLDDIYRAIALTTEILRESRLARKAIDRAKGLHVLSQVTDAVGQVDALVFDGFVSRTGLTQLSRLPVYLKGVQHRMARLSENQSRDRTWQNDIDHATELFVKAGGSVPLAIDSPAHLRRSRWLIEELRINLFAQQLRSAETVSVKRIEKLLKEASS